MKYVSGVKFRCVLTIISEKGRYAAIRLLRTKDEAEKGLLDMIAWLERATEMKVKRVHSDNGSEFQSEAVKHATISYNITPAERNNRLTPHEILFGWKPDVRKIRVFGCESYECLPKKKRTDKFANFCQTKMECTYGTACKAEIPLFHSMLSSVQ